MDFMGEAGPDSTASGGAFDSWGPNFSDQAVWATEDDYRAWNVGSFNETPSNSSQDGRHSQNRSGSEPPNKRSRNAQGSDAHVINTNTNNAKAIGKMFFKTKLCCKFRAGVCPYITNCNFAHGIEELRKPPPNWQEIVAAHEGDRGGVIVEHREEHQIPILTSPDSRVESLRSSKLRHCKKFYTEEGCPYGESCTFLHDEQSRARESVAISVTPTVGGFGNNANGAASLKPSNWKTRICNKWETTGYCPFGSKCHFAHGVAELNKYGGGPVETDGRDSYSVPSDLKQGDGSFKTTETTVPKIILAPHHLGQGVQGQRVTGTGERPGRRFFQKWKGPDRISKIYGDWIDDIE